MDRDPAGLASDRLGMSCRVSVSLPAARPHFSGERISLRLSVAGGFGGPARIPITAAIVVERVNGLGVVGVHVSTAAVVVAVTIAGDEDPGRPGRSPAGGPSGAGRPARRRRRPRRRSPGGTPRRSQVAGTMPALRPARPADVAHELDQAGGRTERAGHDGPTARAGTMPALRGGREAGPRTGRRGCVRGLLWHRRGVLLRCLES